MPCAPVLLAVWSLNGNDLRDRMETGQDWVVFGSCLIQGDITCFYRAAVLGLALGSLCSSRRLPTESCPVCYHFWDAVGKLNILPGSRAGSALCGEKLLFRWSWNRFCANLGISKYELMDKRRAGRVLRYPLGPSPVLVQVPEEDWAGPFL